MDLEAPAGATGRKQDEKSVQRERLSEETPARVMRQSEHGSNAEKQTREDDPKRSSRHAVYPHGQ